MNPKKSLTFNYLQLLTITSILYYYSCLISYSPIAPSHFSVTLPAGIVDVNAGKWGSIMIGAAIYYLGIGAYLLPAIPIAYLSLLTLGVPFKTKSWQLIASSTLASIAASQVLEIFWPIAFIGRYPVSTSGAFGSSLNIWANLHFGSFGVWGLIFACLALVVLIFLSTHGISLPSLRSSQRGTKEQSADGL